MTKPNLFEKYCKNKEHAKEVEKYSLMILSALKNGVEDFKNLPEKATEYLSQASLLHDIGYCIEKKSHHKHTMTIIKNEGIENYTNEEVDIIANVARYHRGSFPDTNKHEAFAQLTQENQTLVTKLGAILRLADEQLEAEANKFQFAATRDIVRANFPGIKEKLIGICRNADEAMAGKERGLYVVRSGRFQLVDGFENVVDE